MKPLRALLPLMFALLLAACETAPPETQTPMLSFEGLPVIALNVARIEVVDNYRPPMAPPHVDHLFRQPPVGVAKEMISRQLTANGSYNTLVITIEDASVKKRDLKTVDGVEGLIRNEPAEEYKARVALRFELRSDDPNTVVSGNASVISERGKTLLEDATIADREMALFRLDEEIMQDLKAGFNGVVKNTFGWK